MPLLAYRLLVFVDVFVFGFVISFCLFVLLGVVVFRFEFVWGGRAVCVVYCCVFVVACSLYCCYYFYYVEFSVYIAFVSFC